MAQSTPKSGLKMQLQPLMPEDMRSELIAALKVQNVQNVRVGSGRRFALSNSRINSPARTQPPNGEEDKRHQLRLQAIKEIRTSEVSYLRQLDLLLEYFVTPLRTNGFLTEKVHNQIFGQLDTIHNLSQELLKKLDDNLDNVVRAFTNLGPFFKLYSVYAFDYRNSLCTLQALMDKNATLKRYITNTESRPEVQMKLISLLIIPIQRIPRYKLLLQQVLLYTSPADEAYKALQGSIRLVEQSVSHINAVVEDYENTQRLITVQNALTNKSLKLVKPGRKILKEGFLRKLKTDGTTSRKYCILMSDMFMYCRVLRDVEVLLTEGSSIACSCVFPLKKCKIVELFRGNFRLTCSGDGTIFSADGDEADSHGWYVAIREAIEMHVQCRKTLRKLSSNRKPMRKKHLQRLQPEDDIMWLLRRKTTSPDRIQKVQAGRRRGLWPFRNMNCLDLNESIGESSGQQQQQQRQYRYPQATPTIYNATTSGGNTPSNVASNAIGSPAGEMEVDPRTTEDSDNADQANGSRHVHFRFPSVHWRY
uniref:DH domain-containing protein n=1 Tax=Anopheles dirus TaxID=7168 RepID=A0A182MXU9_9DIPT